MIEGFTNFREDLTRALPEPGRDQEIQNKVSAYVAAHPSLEASPMSVALAQKVARGEIPYTRDEFEKFQRDFISQCLQKVQNAQSSQGKDWKWLTKKISRLQPFQWGEIEQCSQFAALSQVLKDPALFVQHVQMLVRTGKTRYLQEPRIARMLTPALLEALAENCLQKIREKPPSSFWTYIIDELVQMPSLDYLLFFISLVDLEEAQAQDAIREHVAKGPLQELGLSFTWDPATALWKHEEAKEELEKFYRSLSHLPREKCLEKMQEKTTFWYRSFFGENPTSQNICENYLTFTSAFEEMYFSLRQDMLDGQIKKTYLSRAEQAYREKDIASLQSIREKIPSPEKDVQLFRSCLQQKERFPLLSQFFLFQGITSTWLEFGSGWDHKPAIAFACSLLGKFLDKEKIAPEESLGENIYEKIEASLQKVVYKKFMFCLNLLEKKHSNNPLLQQLRETLSSGLLWQEIWQTLASYQGPYGTLQESDLFLLKKSLELPSALCSTQTECKIPVLSESAAEKWLDWLSQKTFHDAVELPQDSSSLSHVMQGALYSLHKIASQEIKRLSLPSLYLSWLEEAIQKGDLKTLDKIFLEIAYKRYEEGLDKVQSSDLLALRHEHITMPIARKVQQTRLFLQRQEGCSQARYLLQQLETLPRQSVQTFSEIEAAKIELMVLCYLDPIAGYQNHSFYHYLQEKNFSPLFWNRETLNLFLHLHEQFVLKKIIEVKGREEYVLGQEHLIEELEHINPTSFSHLEEIVQCIENKEEISFQTCCNRQFLWAVLKQLNMWAFKGDAYYKPWKKAFEDIPSLDTKIALLEHLYRQRSSTFLEDLIRSPEKKTAEASFAFFKKILETKIDKAEFLFLYDKYGRSNASSFQDFSKQNEKAWKRLESITNWMQSEGKGSLLHRFLEQENLLDREGFLKKKEISEIEQWRSCLMHLQRFRDLVALRRKEQGLAYTPCKIECTDEGLSFINDLAKDLVGEDLFSYTKQDIDQIFDIPSDSWLGTYLQKIGVTLDKQDEQYRKWIELFIVHLKQILPQMKVVLESIPPFYVNVLESADFDLYEASEKGEYRWIAEIADRVLYAQYLGVLLSKKISHKNTIQKILTKQSKEHLPPHEMIAQAKTDLSKLRLDPEDSAYLLKILEGKDDEDVERISWINNIYEWVSSSSYFQTLLGLEFFPSSISICQKMERIEQVLSRMVQISEAELTDSFYPLLIKHGYDQRNIEMLFWLFLEAVHKKYQRHLEKLKEEGIDVSALDPIENAYYSMSIYNKMYKIFAVLKENSANAPYQELLQTITAQL